MTRGTQGTEATEGTQGAFTSLVSLLSLLSLVSLVASVSALLPTLALADTLTFHGDYQRTGRFPAAGPVAPGVLWKFQAAGSIVASPVIGPDGTVYLAGTDGRLYALTPDGSKKWEFQAEESLFTTPSLDAWGRLYFGDLDGWFYSLYPDGSLRWKYRLAEGTDRRILGSPAVSPEGVSFVAAWNNQLYSISPDGGLLWQAALNGLPTGAPALDGLGNVYVACLDSSDAQLAVYKFTPISPTPVWTCREPLWNSSNRVIASPAIETDRNNLYIGTCTNTAGLVFALDLTDGQVVFRKSLPKGILSSPAIRDDGIVLVGCLDGKLYALDGQNGAERWVYETGAPYVFGSPAVDRQGNAYVGDSDGTVHAISRGGQRLWKLTSDANVESAPVVDGGRLYVTSFDSSLYVVGRNANRRWRERRR